MAKAISTITAASSSLCQSIILIIIVSSYTECATAHVYKTGFALE